MDRRNFLKAASGFALLAGGTATGGIPYICRYALIFIGKRTAGQGNDG